MGCFSKFFLFVLNFIVFGVGVAVIALASLILANGSQFQTLLEKGTFTVPTVLLVLGLIVMLIGFFGCFGALRESPCLLYTYATIVLLLLIGQIAVAVYGFIKKDDITEFISDNMVKIFNGYGGSDQDLNKNLDAVQHELKCCGVFNYTDWYSGVIDNKDYALTGSVAPGCCILNVTGCNVGIKSRTDISSLIYTKGCYTLLVDGVKSEAMWLGIGAIILALVQIMCVLIACGLGKRSASGEIY